MTICSRGYSFNLFLLGFHFLETYQYLLPLNIESPRLSVPVYNFILRICCVVFFWVAIIQNGKFISVTDSCVSVQLERIWLCPQELTTASCFDPKRLVATLSPRTLGFHSRTVRNGIWDFWWTKWPWDMFFSESICLLLLLSFHQWSILIVLWPTIYNFSSYWRR